MRLRTKDVDFDRGAIIVRDGKGGRDRVVMLPAVTAAGVAASSSVAGHALP